MKVFLMAATLLISLGSSRAQAGSLPYSICHYGDDSLTVTLYLTDESRLFDEQRQIRAEVRFLNERDTLILEHRSPAGTQWSSPYSNQRPYLKMVSSARGLFSNFELSASRFGDSTAVYRLRSSSNDKTHYFSCSEIVHPNPYFPRER